METKWNEIKWHKSNICTAFEEQTIGSKVTDGTGFLLELGFAVERHDTSKDREPGQHYIVMPEHVNEYVSGGVGRKSSDPGDYVIRVHREGPKMYLKRECALPVDSLAVVVYTREAYLNDPDYDGVEDIGDCTHVIVAVLASSGENAPVTPYRFVHNLAGGNSEYNKPDTDIYSHHFISDMENYIDFLISKAKEVKAYWDEFSVVAD